MTAPAALSDPARLHALHSSGLLDPSPDPALDRFTRLAARLVAAPVALVSLVGDDRQVIKSATGLSGEHPLRELDLADSLCRHAVTSGEPFVVCDTADNALVAGSQAVTELGVRAYVGVPLASREGHALGALCAIDRRPRVWSDADVAAMRDLAAAVEGEIELRRATRRAERGAELEAGGQRVLQMLADGLQLELVLAELARNVERLQPDWRVAVMLLDEAEAVLRPAATANVHEALQAEIETVAVAAQARPCGAAAYFGQRMIVADMEGPGGVRACWSTPVLSPRSEVLGTMTVFRDEPGAPGAADTSLLEMAAHLASTAIARTRSERRLATTALRLGQAQAIARVGSWEWERATDRVFWSDHLYEILGFSPGTPPGHDEFLAHVHPDDQGHVSRTIDDAFSLRRPGYEYECRFVRPDGDSRTLLVRADIGFDADGAPVRSSGIAQDVTELRESQRDLEATARRLEEAQALAQIGSWDWEVDTGRTRWSDQAHRIFGLDPGGPGLTHSAFLVRVHPEDRDRVDRITLDAHLGREPSYQYECRILRPDGSVRTVHVLGEVALDERGRPVRSSGTVQDVTERRVALARLAEAESLARLGSWDWEIVPDRAVWSPQLYRIFGVDPDAFTPSLAAVLEQAHPEDRDRLRRTIETAVAGEERLDTTTRIVRPDGEVRWVRSRADVVRNERGEAVRILGTLQDITDQRRAEEQLRYQALHNPLTDLPNRTLLLDRLRHALRQAERRGSTIAVMALDLDRFGGVNERFGLAAGDAALKAIATRLASHVRPADTVAHPGGDEFLVLCEDLPDEHDALALAARLEAVVAESLSAGDAELRLTASIGIALAHAGEGNAEDLIRDAESAMGRAHERGGGSWEIFDPSLRARLVDRLQLEHELCRALERNELCLHFQPW